MGVPATKQLLEAPAPSPMADSHINPAAPPTARPAVGVRRRATGALAIAVEGEGAGDGAAGVDGAGDVAAAIPGVEGGGIGGAGVARLQSSRSPGVGGEDVAHVTNAAVDLTQGL